MLRIDVVTKNKLVLAHLLIFEDVTEFNNLITVKRAFRNSDGNARFDGLFRDESSYLGRIVG